MRGSPAASWSARAKVLLPLPGLPMMRAFCIGAACFLNISSCRLYQRRLVRTILMLSKGLFCAAPLPVVPSWPACYTESTIKRRRETSSATLPQPVPCL
jgi:hypothetical protein